jgi:predicted O-methyltransferase YrrM
VSSCVLDLYRRKPSWVTTGTIEPTEAAVLATVVSTLRPRLLVEIGTASGVSTAVLATAAEHTGGDWELHTLDAMETCYFDSTRVVGQAALELLGGQHNIFFHRSCTNLDVQRILGEREIDFVFIDASHASPWAAADLLSVLPGLRVGAVVALHDLQLPFKAGYAHQNGARDLFRTWSGQKWVEPSAPNLGLLRFTDLGQALTDIATCLQSDWDAPRTSETIAGFVTLLRPLEDVEYSGRAACQRHFALCAPEVADGNRYTNPSRYPFASTSTLHPNHGGNDLRVVWRGLPTDGAHLHLSACADNPAMQNRGALLHVLSRSGSIERTVTLRPGAIEFIDVPPDNDSSLDLEILVGRAAGQTAEYARVTLSRFTTGTGTVQADRR